MSKVKQLVPKRRFAGFTDAWEQRKLGDLTDVYDGTHQTPQYTDSGIMFLSVENIKTLQSQKYISEEAFKTEFKVFPENGDVLMTRIGDIGTANVFERNEPTAYYVSLALLKCKELDPYFLKESIYSETVKKDLWHRTLHIAFPKKINKNEIEKVQIPYPESRLEQERIGTFFRNLDNLITLHQRKLEKAKEFKRSCLVEMFPAEGQRKPQRRFPGFTGDWEQRKLGDEVQITMGQSPDGSSYTDIPSDYILVQGNADLKNGWVIPRVWTSQVTKKAEAGDLIMSVRAPAGEMGKTAYNAVIGRGVAAIKGNEFIFQSLVKMNFQGYWKRLSCGSTFESLNSDNIKNAELMIPHLNEQLQIGSFFSTLDNLIALHQRKLDKLKALKQACLNEMFV